MGVPIPFHLGSNQYPWRSKHSKLVWSWGCHTVLVVDAVGWYHGRGVSVGGYQHLNDGPSRPLALKPFGC